jgi:hypothetical protein
VVDQSTMALGCEVSDAWLASGSMVASRVDACGHAALGFGVDHAIGGRDLVPGRLLLPRRCDTASAKGDPTGAFWVTAIVPVTGVARGGHQVEPDRDDQLGVGATFTRRRPAGD